MSISRTLRLAAVALSAVVALAACGSDEPAASTTSPPESTTVAPVESEVVNLTQMYGCGHGFWAGDDTETTALLIQPAGAADTLGTEPVELPSTDWRATLMFGTDLFSNWCDDVIEPGEPEVVVAAEGEAVSGTITARELPPLDMDCSGAVAEMDLADVTFEIDGVRYTIADTTISNDTWGCFAG